MELYEKSAVELSDMIKSKHISAKELCQYTLKRIKETDDKLGAFLYISDEEAISRSIKIDERISKGEVENPIIGVPISIKDNISVKSMQNTCASKALDGYISPYNATVIENIKDDLVIVGKVNLDEFAMGSSNESSYYKKVKNPHGLDYVPGGSSGGSAASVAGGQVTLSLGSDTGGSIRQPASYCGILGLKPTYGCVSRYGLVAYASSLDQIGPFARTTEDLAALFSMISGKDFKDATTKETNFKNYKNLLCADTSKLKFALPVEYFSEGISEDVKKAVLKVVKYFEDNGAVIKEVSIPIIKHALAAYYAVSCSEATSNLGKFDGIRYGYRSDKSTTIEELMINSRSEAFGDEVKRRIILGSYILSSGCDDDYYKKAKLVQKKIRQDFHDVLNDFDMIITPTVPDTAFKFGEKSSDPIQMYIQDICTVTANIAGLPAVNVPCGFDKKGLPIGLQLIGNDFSESLLLSTSLKCENIFGGFNKVPKF